MHSNLPHLQKCEHAPFLAPFNINGNQIAIIGDIMSAFQTLIHVSNRRDNPASNNWMQDNSFYLLNAQEESDRPNEANVEANIAGGLPDARSCRVAFDTWFWNPMVMFSESKPQIMLFTATCKS
jgi:hypothetical protein